MPQSDPQRETPETVERPSRRSATATGTRVWLVRHAEVEAAWRGRAYGDLDVPLSADGRARTLELAERFAALAPDAVWCSPLTRALELGRAIAARLQTGLDVRDELREIHRGRWQGLPVTEIEERFPDEVRAFYADPWTFRAHGGECDAQVAARAGRALDDVLALHAGGVVVLATHYNVVRVLAAGALGIPPERSFALRVDPGRSVLLVDGPERWLLSGSNVWDPTASPGARAGATA